MYSVTALKMNHVKWIYSVTAFKMVLETLQMMQEARQIKLAFSLISLEIA
jgi:hypothetical protein